MLDEIDREAMREGQAIRSSNRNQRPRNGRCSIRHTVKGVLKDDLMTLLQRTQNVQAPLRTSRNNLSASIVGALPIK